MKIDFEFIKAGSARFYSHHDLMRFFERALRRADLPVKLTAGFNPRPRMVFLEPLALGVTSVCEHLEIEFTKPVDPLEVMDDLQKLMLNGMSITAVTVLARGKRGRKIAASSYAVSGFKEAEVQPECLRLSSLELESCQNLRVSRIRKGKNKEVNIASSLASVRVEAEEVVVTIKNLNEGKARPVEITSWFAGRLGIRQEDLQVRKVLVELEF